MHWYFLKEGTGFPSTSLSSFLLLCQRLIKALLRPLEQKMAGRECAFANTQGFSGGISPINPLFRISSKASFISGETRKMTTLNSCTISNFNGFRYLYHSFRLMSLAVVCWLHYHWAYCSWSCHIWWVLVGTVPQVSTPSYLRQVGTLWYQYPPDMTRPSAISAVIAKPADNSKAHGPKRVIQIRYLPTVSSLSWHQPRW